MTEMRFNPISGEWILISPDRGERGDYFLKEKEDESFGPGNCPFCPGNEGMIGKIIYGIKDYEKLAGEYLLKVIPNKYPLFTVEQDKISYSVGTYDYHSTVGAHEVIIESREHNLKLSEYSDKMWFNIFNAVKERGNDLSRDIRIKFISFFKNYGFLAGATMKHPHSQIVGMPVVPHRVTEEIQRGMEFYEEKDRCLFCDVLRFESESERKLFVTEHFISFIPYASRYPFQVEIYPKRHSHNFFEITDVQINDLSLMLIKIFQAYNEHLGDIPLNMVLYSCPVNLEGPMHEKLKHINLFYHYHIKIIPRINKYGGIECGFGLHVNPVAPEFAAKVLKGEK